MSGNVIRAESLASLESLAKSLRSEEAPFAFVLEEALRFNAQAYANLLGASGVTLRVATKSIRVPQIFSILQGVLGSHQSGFMSFNPRETRFLYDQGFRNFLLAYPSLEVSALGECLQILKTENASEWDLQNKEWKHFPGVQFAINHLEHLDALEKAASALGGFSPGGLKIPVVLDVDMASRFFGQNLGVLRSSLRTFEDLLPFLKRIQKGPFIFSGVLAYEAQIAGLPDLSFFHKLFKKYSMADVVSRRARLRERLSGVAKNFLLNAGGSGSAVQTLKDPSINELTVGSGFFMPHLFDHFSDLKSLSLRPAQYFSLRVTRKPVRGVVTCQSGGIIASGEVGKLKQPLAVFPEGLSALRGEGFGEVQTPLLGGAGLIIEDLVFCRPAKSGESMEWFQEVLLMGETLPPRRHPTYRGLGKFFR